MRYEGKGVSVRIGSAARVELPPVAYRGRLVGMLFDFDKTFLLPSALAGIRGLKRLYDEHPGADVLIVGHADRRGRADYNRALSEERARAILAFLRDDVDAWLSYYQQKPAGRPWGKTEDDAMRRAVAPDAPASDWPRRKLVTAYLAQDGTSLPPGTKVEIHGCGENHPEVDGDDENAARQNRRVEIFLFDGPIEPRPQATCPAPTGCSQYEQWALQSIETIDFIEAPENAVELELAWPESIAARLDDAVLVLEGEDVVRQERRLSAARREDGYAVVAFHWLDREARVTVTVRTASRTLTLLRSQVVADLETGPTWEAELDELLDPEPPPDDGDAEPAVIARIPDDFPPTERP